MNPHEIIDLVVELEDEVNNGGFHQFFNNSSGDNTFETIQALEIIGATMVADILRRAAFKFPGNMPPRDRRQRLDLLWANFPRTDEFYELDKEFFAYPEDLSVLIAAYKSRFPDDFRGENPTGT
jgi:hypothetical protein